MLNSLKNTLMRLHKSEQGAEGLEKLLLLAALILPLLGILIFLVSQYMVPWLQEEWNNVQDDSSLDNGGGL